MKKSKGSKLLLFGTIIAYCLIGIEIIIMISPFALYFYSVYGPILNYLSASPITSWTTEFFLPHMVFPDDSLIQAITYLQVLLVIGLLFFLFAAVPLYYGRFTGKGVVQMSFYSKIRHPQYLFLAISGLGLLLYWPRFIILIMYITMLFMYYILARNEEWRMQHEQPVAYESYMNCTPMFLPGEPGRRIYSAWFGRIKPKWVGILILYLVVLSVSVLGAVGLRNYAIRQIPKVVAADSLTLVSVFPRPDSEMLDVYNAALRSEKVSGHLFRDKSVNLAYIMPGDFFLTALVTDEDRRFSDDMIERFPEILEWHQHKFRGGLGKFFKIFYNFVSTWSRIETNFEIERLVFVQVKDSNGKSVSAGHVFDMGMKRTPAMIVDVDADTHEVLTVLPTSGSNKWGKMPMPTF